MSDKKILTSRKEGWRDSILTRSQKNPAWWIKEVLGSTLWSKQVEICESLVNNERVAVPACFDDKTEIFTELGWVSFTTLNRSTKVATLKKDQIFFERPISYYQYRYKGSLISIQVEGEMDCVVTPNHRVYIKESEKSYLVKQAFDLYGTSIEIPIPRVSNGKFFGDSLTTARVERKDWNLVDYDGIVYCVQTVSGIILVRRNGIVYFSGNSFGVGKCVEENEKIILSDGRITLAKDLIGKNFSIVAFDEKTQNQVVASAYAESNGIKPVYRITTKLGREIIRTVNHPLYSCDVVKNGTTLYPTNLRFKPVSELKVGDAVALVSKLCINSERSVDDDEVKLLAYLLGDGGITHGITFTKPEGDVKTEFREIVQRLGCQTKDHDHLTVRVIPTDENFRKLERNYVRNLCIEWGIFGKKSKDKSLPEFIWTLNDRQLALFVNRLFACDGWASLCKNQDRGLQKQIGITLASKQLIDDINLLMLRLGIFGRLYSATVTDSNRVGYGNTYYTWAIKKSSEIIKFADIVGIYGKEQKVEELKQYALEHNDQRHVPQWIYRNLDSNYIWDSITKIEYIGEKETVGICVPEYHTYLTTFVEHNTFLAARLCLWWLYNFKPAKVISTAPTGRQVKDLLWKELRNAHSKALMPLGGTPLTLSLTLNDEQFAVGFSTDDTNMDMFTGYHSPNQFVVFDQAGGLPTMVWDAAEGLMTSDNCKWLAISNTAISDCEFANICMPDRKSKYGDWKVIPIRAIDSPNVKAGKNLFPGLISHNWIEKRKEAWGEDDPLYRIFVLAEFVPSAQMSVLPYLYLMKSYDNPGTESDWIEVGLDVARSGLDSTVWAARSGTRLLELKRVTGNNTMEVVGQTVLFIDYLEKKYQKRVTVIKVDIIGIGAGVYDRSIELNLPIIPINNAETKDIIDKERYANVRAEMAWAFRHRVENGGLGLASVHVEDADLIEYMKADLQILKYKITSSGKIQLQSKDEIRLELGRSPDYWDALVMAFESPGGGPAMLEFVSEKQDDKIVITSKIMDDAEWKRLLGIDVDPLDRSFR